MFHERAIEGLFGTVFFMPQLKGGGVFRFALVRPSDRPSVCPSEIYISETISPIFLKLPRHVYINSEKMHIKFHKNPPQDF